MKKLLLTIAILTIAGNMLGKIQPTPPIPSEEAKKLLKTALNALKKETRVNIKGNFENIIPRMRKIIVEPSISVVIPSKKKSGDIVEIKINFTIDCKSNLMLSNIVLYEKEKKSFLYKVNEKKFLANELEKYKDLVTIVKKIGDMILKEDKCTKMKEGLLEAVKKTKNLSSQQKNLLKNDLKERVGFLKKIKDSKRKIIMPTKKLIEYPALFEKMQD